MRYGVVAKLLEEKEGIITDKFGDILKHDAHTSTLLSITFGEKMIIYKC